MSASNRTSSALPNTSTVTFPEKSIVLLIHGYNGTASSMDDLVETLQGLGTILNYYNVVFLNVTLSKGDTYSSNSFKSIKTAFNEKANANVFVKVSFTNDLNGDILEQSEELFAIITNLRSIFPNKKIITVGYSKGGVVAMECAIDYPSSIDKLISIGTPYTTTIGEHLYDFVEDCVQTFYNGTALIQIAKNPLKFIATYVAFANNILEHTLRNVINSIINYKIVIPDLMKRWNQLCSRPAFTPIASRSLTINDTRESDFVVPVESALATGFYGKSYSDDILLVKNQESSITLITNQFTNGAFDLVNLVAKMNGMVSLATMAGLADFISTFLPFILSVSDESSETKKNAAKYAHTTIPALESFLGSSDYQLKNETVAWRVIAGLQA